MKHHLLALISALAAGAVSAAPVTPTRCSAVEMSCAVPELALRGWDGAFASARGQAADASVEHPLHDDDEGVASALTWDDIERLDGAEHWVPWRQNENELAAWAERDSTPAPVPVARRREPALKLHALPAA